MSYHVYADYGDSIQAPFPGGEYNLDFPSRLMALRHAHKCAEEGALFVDVTDPHGNLVWDNENGFH